MSKPRMWLDKDHGGRNEYQRASDAGLSTADWEAHVRERVDVPLDVERLARALTKEYRYLGRQPESEDDFLRFATVVAASYADTAASRSEEGAE